MSRLVLRPVKVKAAILILVIAAVITAAVCYFGGTLSPPDAAIASASMPATSAAPDRDRSAPVTVGNSVPNPTQTRSDSATPTSAPVVVAPTPTDAEHRHFKRFFRTRLKPSLRDIAKEFQNGRPARIAVPLFDGKEAMVVVDSFTPYGEEGGAFSGKVEGDEGSFVNIAFYEDAESGSIQLPAQNLVYAIQPEPDGSVLIGEVDVAALGSCGSCAGPVPGKVP